MQKYFHQIAMGLILAGGVILLAFSLIWFKQGNVIMASGMFIMGTVALSNFYLHRMSMKRNSEK